MNRLVGAVGVVALWVLLFGELTVANLLGGAVVAGGVLVVFRRPPSRVRHRVSPWGCVRLVVELMVKLPASSVRVAIAVIRPTPARVRTQVVRVPLSTDSELVGTVVGDLISLTPGTLTLDVRHDPERLIVHALGDVDADEVRASVRALENRVLRAITPVPSHDSPGGGAR
jgi:multicomponent Na+:H+ antiporter subunit E